MKIERTSAFIRRMVAGVLACTLMVGTLAIPAAPAFAQSDGGKDASAATRRVTIIFRNGNTVTGEVLSENETSIRMRIEVAGIMGETAYNKSEILEIKAVESTPTDTAAAPAETKKDEPADKASGSGPTIYVVDLIGEFGREVNVGPMEDVYKDIKKHQPDVLVLRFDHQFQSYGEKKADFEYDLGSFDQLEIARKVADIFRLRLETDREWTKKPRLVGWVNKALGAAAFLPFICPEVYFTTDGLHGGIGYLDYLFAGRGDEVVRQKQISLRLARAEGLAQLGGYDSIILAAMARTDMVLSVSFRDGTPKFLPRMPESPDEVLLTDDGREGNRDMFADIIRGKGNDVLTLDSEMAYRIGFSKGTADTLDDLAYRMGLPRDYQVVKGKGSEIIKEWGKRVDQAEARIMQLIRQLQNQELKAPGGYRERTEFRGRRISILKQIQSILYVYQESINPARIGSPEGTMQQIEQMITELEAEQRLDRP